MKTKEYELDAIIYATGFDAMTGSVTRIKIAGANGLTIQEKWRDGPRTYLGLTIAGFPNMFNIAGPGSPSVLASMVTAIEQHVELIASCLWWMRETGKVRIEATVKAEQAWGEKVEAAAQTSLRSTCDSWYLGSNIPGKPRVFMPYIGGFPEYVAKCNKGVARGYEGYSFDE